MTYLTAPLSSRNQFGQFLTERGLLGTIVEIGTHRGEFAEVLLRNWHGRKMCLVDPYWRASADYEPQVKLLPSKGISRIDDYRAAYRLLARYERRYKFMVEPSLDACGKFVDDSIDFVYVDGDHTREAVFSDLIWWWPKLKTGGIMAGHDWVCPGEDSGLWAPGIQYAVGRLCELHGIEFVYLIVEENGLPWSFYTIKQ